VELGLRCEVDNPPRSDLIIGCVCTEVAVLVEPVVAMVLEVVLELASEWDVVSSDLPSFASFRRFSAINFFWLIFARSPWALRTAMATLDSTMALIVEQSTLRSFSRIFCVWVVSLLTVLLAKPAAMAAEPISLRR